MVDKDKKKDEEDDKEEEEDTSETSVTYKSRVPSIDVFGTKIKLDTLTFASLGIGLLGAIAGGYMLYNQYNQNKTNEEAAARKQNDMQRQQAYMNEYYRNQMINEARKRDLLPKNQVDSSAKVDMSKHKPPEPVEYEPTLQDILGYRQNSMPFYPSTQNIFATTPASPLIKNESVSSSIAGPHDEQIGFVDMDKIYEPGQTAPEYQLPEANPINKNKLKGDEEDEEELIDEEPSPEELYNQLGSSYNY